MRLGGEVVVVVVEEEPGLEVEGTADEGGSGFLGERVTERAEVMCWRCWGMICSSTIPFHLFPPSPPPPLGEGDDSLAPAGCMRAGQPCRPRSPGTQPALPLVPHDPPAVNLNLLKLFPERPRALLWSRFLAERLSRDAFDVEMRESLIIVESWS